MSSTFSNTQLKINLIEKLKLVRSGKGSEYYGKYNETSCNLGSFVRMLQENHVFAQYTMSEIPQQNGVIDVVRIKPLKV